MKHIITISKKVINYSFRYSLFFLVISLFAVVLFVAVVNKCDPEYAKINNLFINISLLLSVLKISVLGGFGLGLLYGIFFYFMELSIEKRNRNS